MADNFRENYFPKTLDPKIARHRALHPGVAWACLGCAMWQWITPNCIFGFWGVVLVILLCRVNQWPYLRGGGIFFFTNQFAMT